MGQSRNIVTQVIETDPEQHLYHNIHSNENETPSAKTRSTRFCIKKFSEIDVFSMKPGETFFGAISDPFDLEHVSQGNSHKSFTFCMYPTPAEFKANRNQQRFAPLLAICFSDADKVVDSIKSMIPSRLIKKPISRLIAEEKITLLDGIEHAFDDAFVGGISVPMELLTVKEDSRLKVTYSTALGMLLIPLLRMHSDAGISNLSLRLPSFGGSDYDAIKRSKELLKAMGFNRDYEVSLFDKTSPELWLCFRFIYWSVHQAHNMGNNTDLLALEGKLSSQHGDAGT